jgi:superfamily II DNA or RNA helicase
MILRGYQNEYIQQARAAIAEHKKILLVAPTGAGKTAIIVEIIKNTITKNKTIFFFVHDKYLLGQTAEKLKSAQIDFGYIAAGFEQKNKNVMLCMIQSFNRRSTDIKKADLVIIDEAHRTASNTYKTIASEAKYLVGLTATPARTDGQPLGDIYKKIVEVIRIHELIKKGFLCDYDLYAADICTDFDDIKTKNKDYDSEDLEEKINTTTITGDAIKHYKKLSENKRCVVLCVNIKHARAVAEMYKAAGIPAYSITSEENFSYRKLVIDKFKAGEIKIITAVNLLVEGVDIPEIECVQWLRPTKSLIIYMQGNGRGLRTAADKNRLIILDHVGNMRRFGMPCDHREWSLTEKQKEKTKSTPELEVTICKECFFTYNASKKQCPKCGTEKISTAKQIIYDDKSELKKIDKIQAIDIINKARKPNTLEHLINYAITKNYKNPSAWAAFKFAAQKGRKPSKHEFSHAARIRNELTAAHHAFFSEQGSFSF